jgi:hypothetical protein
MYLLVPNNLYYFFDELICYWCLEKCSLTVQLLYVFMLNLFTTKASESKDIHLS